MLRARRVGIARIKGGGVVDPIRALFANGESGAVLMPGTSYGVVYVERTGAAASTIALPGDPVGTYRCLVTGKYYVAPSDSARPVLGSSGGLFWLTFDGIDDVLECDSNIVLTADWSAAASAKFDNTTGTQVILDADNTAAVRYAQMLRRSTTSAQAIAFNTAVGATSETMGTVGAVVPHYMSAIRSATALEGWLDGVSNGATAATGTPQTATRPVTWGANRAGASGSLTAFLAGRIYGGLYIGRQFTPTERLSIDTIMKTKAGV